MNLKAMVAVLVSMQLVFGLLVGIPYLFYKLT